MAEFVEVHALSLYTTRAFLWLRIDYESGVVAADIRAQVGTLLTSAKQYLLISRAGIAVHDNFRRQNNFHSDPAIARS